MDKLYYIAEAVRYASSSWWKRLLIRLFGHRQIIDQGDEVITLATYQGKLYFLDREKKS